MARVGNVIGGGDWAENRIVSDAIRALMAGGSIGVRSPASTRPWQHVLEPLGGYLLLAEQLHAQQDGVDTAFNFGPDRQATQTVCYLVKGIRQHWPGRWEDYSDLRARHGASRLDLSTDRPFPRLNWLPRWNFSATVAETVGWYRSFHRGESARDLCQKQIESYMCS